VALAPGTRLPPYEIVAPLGAGGMGEVYRAHDARLGRDVALKVLPHDLASDPGRRARFEQEARAASALSHPNIVSIHDIGTHEGDLFVTMELVEGATLRELIARGPLGAKQVVEIAVQVAEGLARAHRAGIVHRDLKPENVMVSPEGHAKILDFGLAKRLDLSLAPDTSTPSDVATAERPLTEIGSVVGTVAYMSPEQAQGKAVDARSDVFALGILLYEMTTRRRPFEGDNRLSILSAILRDMPPPITAVDPTVPAPLSAIVLRCLAKDPAARYADAAGVRDELRALRDSLSSGTGPAVPPRSTRRLAAMGAAAVVVLAALGAWGWQRGAEARWARGEGLPQLTAIVDRIQGLEEGRESWDAWRLARRIDAAIPGDPLVELLRPKFARRITITSEPPGAEVRAWYYDEPEGEGVVLGTTPLKDVLHPRGFTRLRLTLEGRPPVDDAIWNISILGQEWAYELPAAGGDSTMAAVPRGKLALFIPGLDHLDAEPTAAFLIDRHEVTQKDYKRFLDAGGYADPKWWKEPFVLDGREIPWSEAVARFTDRTGRPGPATWEVGAYPPGDDDLPVAGVSYHEAAAYAAWAGKSLPTVFHWNRVAFTLGSARIVPAANLAGKGPVAVGTTRSMSRYGVSEMAGNVREWTVNESARGQRFILGGGWNDPDYAFADAYAQPAFDRSPTNGFRCIKAAEPEPNAARLERPIERPFRDFRAEKPVPDEVFAQYVRQFAYDPTPLNARVEEEKAMAGGLRQKITFDAAYGGERMMAYLFLPPAARPPYQVVVLFPGSGSIDAGSSANLDLGRVDFLQSTGRAVLFPIYKATYERRSDLQGGDYPRETTGYKDHLVMWAKDLGRSLDYVETRSDLDATRIAYYGLSWGGALGAVLPAVEPRIRANVLYVAGLTFQRALPEADAINYVTRVKQPTLILNGEHDFFFPQETSQKPLFDLLGTPAADKKRLVFPGGHSVPRTDMIKESLAWLDRYLGPVAKP
jgi:dienelactone hydrolase